MQALLQWTYLPDGAFRRWITDTVFELTYEESVA